MSTTKSSDGSERCPEQPKTLAEAQRILTRGIMRGGKGPTADDRAMALYMIAKDAWESNTVWMQRRPPVPVRPASFPARNVDLVGQLIAIKRKRPQSRTADDKKLLRDHGAWRAMVWRLEERAVGAVQLLLTVAEGFYLIGPEEEERFRRVQAFLREQWGVDVPPFPDNPRDVCRAAARRAYDATMPAWVANAERIPPGAGAAEPKIPPPPERQPALFPGSDDDDDDE